MPLLVKLNKCLCADLRTGSIIIGVIGLIWGLYFTASAFIVFDGGKGGHHDNDAGETFVIVIKVIFGLLQVVISGIMIYGAVKRIPKLIFPWICVSVVSLVLSFIMYVILGILGAVGGALAAGLSMILGAIVGALIELYCISVVNSYHTTLKNGEPVSTA